MTIALCMICGELKRGAWCTCASCGEKPEAGDGLDLMFTDHYLTPSTLEQLGAVFQEIRSLSETVEQARQALVRYISTHHQGVIRSEFPEEQAKVLDALLSACTLPDVTIERRKRDPEWEKRRQKLAEPEEGF